MWHDVEATGIAWTLVLVLCVDISVVMASQVYVVNAQSGTSDERDTYYGKAAKSYNYRFGVAHPFLPSNIETKDGQFIDPKIFLTAQYCGHCHQEAHAQCMLRMTRGQCGSLHLYRNGLAPSTPCRSPGALRKSPFLEVFPSVALHGHEHGERNSGKATSATSQRFSTA